MQYSVSDRSFIYWIKADNSIESVNADWEAFARENQAAHLSAEAVVGQSLFRFLTGKETRQLYRIIIERVRQLQRQVVLPFRCDGPTVRRFMELVISPCSDGRVQFEGRTIREEPRDAISLFDTSVDRTDEYVVLCGWCNRVQVKHEWLEVEFAMQQLELFNLDQLPQISHGICADCADLMRREFDQIGHYT